MFSLHNRLLAVASGSIVVAVVVMALKYVAFQITGSVALFSDTAGSIVNVITAGVALWAIWLAGKPADIRHPFGHSKAEYFSAVLEGVLIIVAALVICTRPTTPTSTGRRSTLRSRASQSMELLLRSMPRGRSSSLPRVDADDRRHWLRMDDIYSATLRLRLECCLALV